MPERLRLRRMTAADLPAVRELEARAYDSGFAPGTLEHELEHNGVARYVILERSEGDGAAWQAAGFAGLWLQFDEAHVVTCAVDPVHRRRSFGSLLVHALVSIALSHGMAAATLEVRVSNAPARALYRRYGFWDVGERRKYYTDNNEDAVIMTTEALDGEHYRGRLERLGVALDGAIPAWREMLDAAVDEATGPATTA